MRRNRQQDGYIFKARGIWYVRYFDTRVIDGEAKRVRIAKQIAKAAAKKILEVIGSEFVPLLLENRSFR